MNWDRIEEIGSRSKVKEQWGKITDDDLMSSPASGINWPGKSRVVWVNKDRQSAS